jgi:glutaconyl-CoA decarboxylase
VVKELKEPSVNKKSKKPDKLLDRFRIKVSNQEFIIEIFNQDLLDEQFKKYSILVNGTQYTVEVESLSEEEDKQTRPIVHDSPLTKTPTQAPVAKPVDTTVIPSAPSAPSGPMEGKVLTAPMPGKILEIKIKVGDHVESGQPLVILEAMKMENVMTAPATGNVKEIPIKVGANVNQGETLVVIE